MRFTGLLKSHLYRFAYRVQNINGWSPVSDTVLIRTADVPSKPAPIVLVQATATTMTLQFSTPVDNGGSEITTFELYINDGGLDTLPTVKVASYSTNLMYHTLDVATDGLTTGTVYKLVFRAINEAGNSEDSDISSFALVDVPFAPSAPTVIYSFTTETSVAVEWEAVISL